MYQNRIKAKDETHSTYARLDRFKTHNNKGPTNTLVGKRQAAEQSIYKQRNINFLKQI